MSKATNPNNANPKPQDKRETRAWSARALWKLCQVERLLGSPDISGRFRPHRLWLAERLLKQVQRIAPDFVPLKRAYFWETLAAAWFSRSDIARTEYCLRRMAELQPGCADAYLNLGYYLTETGLHNRAVQAYWEGLRVNPADQFIIYNLAQLYRSAGKQRVALKLLDDAIALSKRPAILHKAKGDLLYEWGQFGMAVLSYRRALAQMDRRHTNFLQETRQRLGECYYELDREECIQEMMRRGYSRKDAAGYVDAFL